MVRLKAISYSSSTGATVFQFQYGTIEGFVWITDEFLLITFQFQYGTIEGQIQINNINSIDISIPVWYDWR